MPTEGAHLRRLAMDLLGSYIERLEPRQLGSTRSPGGAHSGLVAGVGSQVIARLEAGRGAPGARTWRTTVEVHHLPGVGLALRDPSIYEADYGAGRAKLHAESTLDEVPPEAQEPRFRDHASREVGTATGATARSTSTWSIPVTRSRAAIRSGQWPGAA